MTGKNVVIKCQKAESSVVGVVIILMLTTLSVGAILLYGIPTINDMQDMAKAQKAEQAFTVFDSKDQQGSSGRVAYTDHIHFPNGWNAGSQGRKQVIQ